jgi:hypothetical protein
MTALVQWPVEKGPVALGSGTCSILAVEEGGWQGQIVLRAGIKEMQGGYPGRGRKGRHFGGFGRRIQGCSSPRDTWPLQTPRALCSVTPHSHEALRISWEPPDPGASLWGHSPACPCQETLTWQGLETEGKGSKFSAHGKL